MTEGYPVYGQKPRMKKNKLVSLVCLIVDLFGDRED